MKRGLITSNIATLSLLIVWTSSQTIEWKVVATPLIWGLVAWLIDEIFEIREEWKEERKNAGSKAGRI